MEPSYSFDDVTGSFPSQQTIGWSDMKDGQNPETYMEGNDLVGKIEINGNVRYYRLNLTEHLDKGYSVTPKLNKKKCIITLMYQKF